MVVYHPQDGGAACCVRFIDCLVATDGDAALNQSTAARDRMACFLYGLQRVSEGDYPHQLCQKNLAGGAQHRLEFERLHGQGTFILELPDSTKKLRRLCLERGAWIKDEGACMDGLLSVILETGGVPAIRTTDTRRSLLLLPLHSSDYFSLRGTWTNLTSERAAQLIFTGGPCIGSLWVDGSYTSKHHYSDDDEEDMLVYRGCDPEKKKKPDKGTGLHAVVCYAYRFIGQELHIRVMAPPKVSQEMDEGRALLHANLRRQHDAMMIQKGKEKLPAGSVLENILVGG
ncbi:hypothetical protein E2562_034824 [Oryza meyeriana var. granulata]|uniref:Uncharacterized protein n=1 Tax=Oryza meyeriana var. granulata TaxID=110450 RepID=A0A6G1E6S6_9ORYZ|nr:hypothetical protein E2562_034824 [Oryza meyeriana var. granulata]